MLLKRQVLTVHHVLGASLENPLRVARGEATIGTHTAMIELTQLEGLVFTMIKLHLKSYVLAAALSLSFLGSAQAETDVHDGTTINGTVPFCASWELVEADRTGFTDGVDIAMFDADKLVIPDLIVISDFDCNTKYKITAAKSGWTLPAAYLATADKKADGSDTDLRLMVDNLTAGFATDGMAALGGFGAYTAITTAGSDILGGGSVGAAAGHGVENAAADINAEILMDWASDIVGAYAVTVTLTISEVTE